MPVRSHQIPGGARVLIFECEICGEPACYGVGVNLRQALRAGDVSKAGKWYCPAHWKRQEKNMADDDDNFLVRFFDGLAALPDNTGPEAVEYARKFAFGLPLEDVLLLGERAREYYIIGHGVDVIGAIDDVYCERFYG